MAKRPKIETRIIKSRNPASVAKSEAPENLDPNAARNADEWVAPSVDMKGLEAMVSQSSILPQCIRAYKNNIAGFGIGVRYKGDETDEDKEALAEYNRAEEIIDLLNFDADTKEVFEDVIEAREIYGIAYLEIIRNVAGEVTGIDFIKDTPSVQKSIPLFPYVEVEQTYNGRTEKRRKKFCKYKQQVGAKTIYFKEIGDPRPMNILTGKYEDSLTLDKQANEILEFAIGVKPYGEVRWIGQVLGIDGSRKAESLNNRYFAEGRHTPLIISIEGGTLTDDSFKKLQDYMDGIKGENGQHAFIVLELADTDSRTDLEGEAKPVIKFEKLADILQKDELFQDYLDNNRRKAQSAFQLPDLYVGYTTDFNRATAQTAREVTEEQVFQPERESLAWIINNKLLAGYGFKYVEAYFKAPTITNPDDIMKLLNVAERAGGLTPNKAKEIALSLYGEDSTDFEEEWGEIPLAVARTMAPPQGEPGSLDLQMSQQIRKAVEHGDDEIAAVLKEIRALLENEEDSSKKLFTNNAKSDIVKYSPEQPRDENGRFGSGGGSGFSSPNEKGFADAIASAKANLPDKDAWRVDAHDAGDYTDSKLFTTPGGSCVAVEKDGNIVSVCKNPGDSVRGSDLMKQAVANGGDRLDAFGEGLYQFYVKSGFEPVSWTPFNENYAPPGWTKGRDDPEPIVFYKHTGSSTSTTYTDFINNTAPCEGPSGYDDARAARDKGM